MLIAELSSRFAAWDWVVVAGYLAVVIVVGFLAGRGRKSEDDFFLAGRSMPMWAVAVSVLATSQSAATFVGGPQQAFATDLTYLAGNLGALIAVVFVALFFIPAYYKRQVTSIYELVGQCYGPQAQQLTSGMFMVGRVFASGARLFIVAIPFALIAFGSINTAALVAALCIITVVATTYTLFGGMRAVIWTDVLQATIYIATIVIALLVLLNKFPVGIGEALSALSESGDGAKLTIIDTSLGLDNPYSIWAIVIGLTLFNMAAFGTDQDLTQRMLTCPTARQGSWSVIVANLIGWPVILLFLLMGLLLFIYMKRPDLVGLTPAEYFDPDSRRVFLDFIVHEMPVGLRGLMMAGLFAAAMSSMDSALNAMASTTVADFYRPWRRKRVGRASTDLSRERRVSRLAVAVWAVMLLGFAVGCVFWQKESGETLINFALGVMVFAYAGLLGVFVTAIFTRHRGSPASVAGALVTGFTVTVILQPFVWTNWLPGMGLYDDAGAPRLIEHLQTMAFPWRMTIATALSLGVCCLGRRGPTSRQT